MLAALASGCGPQRLIVIGANPCADGGTGANCPDPCADGGVLNGDPRCVDPGLLDDLVGYWRLDDAGSSAGTMTANDWSGRGNHGTLVDLDPLSAWTSGRAAGGLDVDANGFINVPLSPSIDSITDQVTISGWGYLHADGMIVDFATIASREEGSTLNQYYHIAIDGKDARDAATCFIKTANGTSILQQLGPLPRETWIHLACTYDGTIAILYLNGQQVRSEARTGRFVADTTPFILGANGNGATRADITERFPGLIDEVMLYRRALSGDQIRMLYDGALFSPQYRTDGGARD